MKNASYKIVALVLTAVLALGFMTACKKGDSGNSSSGTTLAEFLGGEEFDALSKGIIEGKDMPSSVHYFATNSYTDDIKDPAAINDLWTRLTNIEIDTSEKIEDPGIDDASILFQFKWPDGREYRFDFVTTEYFKAGDVYYRTKNPDSVNSISKGAVDYIVAASSAAANDKKGVEVDYSSGVFQWDAEGSGTSANYSIDYQDNGDEAPSVIIIKKDDGSAEIIIDAAYEITAMRSAKDEKGPYIDITYTTGDHANHTDHAYVRLRMVNGQLVSEAIEGK